jgi:antitoxin CptB
MIRSESRDSRLKRLAMRSHRRGIREMDLILGPFADAHLAGMSAADLDRYEALLDENDQDLLAWITGAAPMPDRWRPLLSRIMAAHRPRPPRA